MDFPTIADVRPGIIGVQHRVIECFKSIALDADAEMHRLFEIGHFVGRVDSDHRIARPALVSAIDKLVMCSQEWSGVVSCKSGWQIRSKSR